MKVVHLLNRCQITEIRGHLTGSAGAWQRADAAAAFHQSADRTQAICASVAACLCDTARPRATTPPIEQSKPSGHKSPASRSQSRPSLFQPGDIGSLIEFQKELADRHKLAAARIGFAPSRLFRRNNPAHRLPVVPKVAIDPSTG